MATQQQQTPHIVLHWLENSRSQRIVWLLEELRLPYELKTYKRIDRRAPEELKQIHPLGKSPVITVQIPGQSQPLVIAETAFIIEYLTDYYGQHLVPQRYQPGKENQLGGESEAWLRYRHLMHYAEGSLGPYLLSKFLFQQIEGPDVPWIARPITKIVSKEVGRQFIDPNIKTHLDFLEHQLQTSGGNFLTGPNLSGADILLSFPILALKARAGVSLPKSYPKLDAYINQYDTIPAYQTAIKRVEEETGEKYEVFNVARK